MSFRRLLYLVLLVIISVAGVLVVLRLSSATKSKESVLNPVIASSQISDIQNLTAGTFESSPSAVLSAAIVASPSPTIVKVLGATVSARPEEATESAEEATPAPKIVIKPKEPEKPKASFPQESPQAIDSYFQKYASQYIVSESQLRKIAVCESGYNSNSRNGVYGGMFQFVSSTWVSTRQAMGENSDPELRFKAEEAIKTAAFKISHNGLGAWVNCAK